MIACCAIFLVGGCKNTAQVFEDNNDGGWFSKKVDIFAKPDWARPSTAQVSLGPRGPAGPEDLVDSDGRCAAPPAATAQASDAAPAQAPAPGDSDAAVAPAAKPASAPPDKLDLAAPSVAGGIGLGMTECQAVQRAGAPSNVAISAGDKGERKAVLTFLSGPWPGIYTFADGRLKVVERAPEPPKPAAPAKKPQKKKPSAPRTAHQDFQRSFVQ